MSADNWIDRALQAAADDATDIWMPRVWRAFTGGIFVGAIGMWVIPLVLS